MGRIIEIFRNEDENYNTLEKISRVPIANFEYPDKEFHACICLTIKNHLKAKLKNSDQSNLEETASIQKEIIEIQEKLKNF